MCNESCIVKYGQVFVVLALLLMVFVPVSTHVYIFHSWLGYHDRLYMTIPFWVAVTSGVFNYGLACSTHPGSVPLGYTHTRGLKPRWCSKCLAYKPPRAHHCSHCQACVLRMDHHCPWLNNCVGHYNIPHFIRFLVSITIACIWCLGLIGQRILDLVQWQNQVLKMHSNNDFSSSSSLYTPPVDGNELLFMVINVLILFVLLFTVGFLGLWQVMYAFGNETTIEDLEVSRFLELQKRGKIPLDMGYPFHLGWLQNLKSTFGSHPFTWIWPQSAPGNGLDFEMNHFGSKMDMWPPREYFSNPGNHGDVSDDSEDYDSESEPLAKTVERVSLSRKEL